MYALMFRNWSIATFQFKSVFWDGIRLQDKMQIDARADNLLEHLSTSIILDYSNKEN